MPLYTDVKKKCSKHLMRNDLVLKEHCQTDRMYLK